MGDAADATSIFIITVVIVTEILCSVPCPGTTDANELLANSGPAKKQYTVPVKYKIKGVIILSNENILESNPQSHI